MSPIAKLFKPFKDSYTAFLRIFLCDFLPDLDWIVYSDVDTLWFRDICELWRERDDSVSALWCKDCPSAAMFVHEYSKAWNPDFDESRYCCSGVMLMNLKRMRQKRLPEECSAFARKWGSTFFPDQDILNHVLRDDEKHLDQRWDCMMPDPRALEGVVVHCNGVGQFFNGPYDSWRVLYNIWFEYYFEVIKGEKFPLPLSKRLVFAAMGLFYPPRWMIRLFTWPFHLCRTDQIWRTFFFSWLRLRLERLRRG